VTRRIIAALLCVAMLGAGAKPAHNAHNARKPHKPVGKPVLPIALVLNGTRLQVNPPPVFYEYHLLVPVRRILTALGLEFDKHGPTVRTYVGSSTVTMRIGSLTAQINQRPVQLDAAPVEINNVLYAPLRFFTQALGAQAVFDRQTNSVEIISTLVGATGNGIVTEGGLVQMLGTVTAIDLNSDPPSLTLTYNASVRTVPIRRDVSVVVQDVNTGTSNSGDLAAIHSGDYAQLFLDKGGHAKRIIDAFGSRNGTVAAVAAGQIVLDDGHVITPSRDTTITLNGASAGVDQIAIGDQVTVRYNIDSSDARQIIATRKSSGSPPPPGPISITSIDVSPTTPLKAGDSLYVTMHGTPRGLAAYDIGPYVTNQVLNETQPGVYMATYVIPRGVNFASAPVFGHLSAHGTDAPQAESRGTVTVATVPPGIDDVAPNNGVSVNNTRPSIYATFTSNTVDVNPSSERLEVNGHDVTSSCVRTSRFIHYTPGIDYVNGTMRVRVTVSDMAGNTTTKSWTFFIAR
jgi:hypothetical protein